jgi:hypothetical protein
MNTPATPAYARILVACSHDFADQHALVQALFSLLLDTIEGPREYYYLHCPAIDGVLADNVIGGSVFHELRARTNLSDRRVALFLVEESEWSPSPDAGFRFTHVMTSGADPLVDSVLASLEPPLPIIIRLD